MTLLPDTRVLAPVWGINEFGRFRPQFASLIGKVKDIQLVTYCRELRLPPEFEGDCRLSYISGPGRYPPGWRDLYDVAVEVLTEVDDFDVIYTRSRPAVYQMLDVVLARLAKKPVVMHALGNAGEVRRQSMGATVEKQFSDAVEAVTLNNYDRIVPINSTLGNHLKRLVLDPGQVTSPLPISVNADHFKPVTYPEELTVGYAGRVSPEKGCEFLRRVMNGLPNTRFEAAGHVMMDGWEFPDNCHYLGALPYTRMPAAYQRWTAITLPSFTEGLPNVILEAYASGRPVMVTPEAHPPELPVFGWELPRELGSWQKTIVNIDLDRAREEGLRARAWIKANWPSWDDWGNGMASILKDVM